MASNIFWFPLCYKDRLKMASDPVGGLYCELSRSVRGVIDENYNPVSFSGPYGMSLWAYLNQDDIGSYSFHVVGGGIDETYNLINCYDYAEVTWNDIPPDSVIRVTITNLDTLEVRTLPPFVFDEVELTPRRVIGSLDFPGEGSIDIHAWNAYSKSGIHYIFWDFSFFADMHCLFYRPYISPYPYDISGCSDRVSENGDFTGWLDSSTVPYIVVVSALGTVRTLIFPDFVYHEDKKIVSNKTIAGCLLGLPAWKEV